MIILIFSTLVVVLLLVLQGEKVSMTVTSTGIKNGVIDSEYGKNGTEFNINGVPTYSLPFRVENAPKGTKTYAIVLEDKDAVPVSGGFS